LDSLAPDGCIHIVAHPGQRKFSSEVAKVFQESAPVMRHSCHIFAAKEQEQEQSHRILDLISGSIILSVFYVWTLRVNFFFFAVPEMFKNIFKNCSYEKAHYRSC
jgi:hypothetical protein